MFHLSELRWWLTLSHLRTPWSTTMALCHLDCNCPWQGYCTSSLSQGDGVPGTALVLIPAQRSRRGCGVPSSTPSQKGTKGTPPAALILSGWTYERGQSPTWYQMSGWAACEWWDLARKVLGVTKCLCESDIHLYLGKHGLHGQPGTPKWAKTLISSRCTKSTYHSWRLYKEPPRNPYKIPN